MPTQPDFQLNDMDMGIALGDQGILDGILDVTNGPQNVSASLSSSRVSSGNDMRLAPDHTFSWEMIALGLEEPLPPQDTINEL